MKETMKETRDGRSRYCNSMVNPNKYRVMAADCNCRSKEGGVGIFCPGSLGQLHITDLIKGKQDGLAMDKDGILLSALKRVFTKPKFHKKKWKWKWDFGRCKHQDILSPISAFADAQTKARKSIKDSEAEENKSEISVVFKEQTKIKTPSKEQEGEQIRHEKKVISKKEGKVRRTVWDSFEESEGEQNRHEKSLVSNEHSRAKKTLNEYEGKQNQLDKKPVKVEEEQNRQVSTVVAAAATAAEAAEAAHAAACAIVGLTGSSHSPKHLEEIAAIKIQSVFRAYLARRSLYSPRGLMRLQAFVHGQSVRRQATSTLRSMQVLVKVHSQIDSRRIRMAEQNRARQYYLEQKHPDLKHKTSNNESTHQREWDNSTITIEEEKARLQSKVEASIKRERTMAYAFSRQVWRNAPKPVQTMLMEMDLDKPHWGWSWLERWMATRPWDNYKTIEKAYSLIKLNYILQNGRHISHIGLKNPISEAANGAASSKPFTLRNMSSGWRGLTLELPGGVSSSKLSMSTMEKPNSEVAYGVTCSRLSTMSMKKPDSQVANGFTSSRASTLSNFSSISDDDIRSNYSTMRSGRTRDNSSYSVASSVKKNDESIVRPIRFPNYMASTESTKAKSRSQSNPKQRLTFPLTETGSSSMPHHKTSIIRPHSGPLNLGSSGSWKSGNSGSLKSGKSSYSFREFGNESDRFAKLGGKKPFR